MAAPLDEQPLDLDGTLKVAFGCRRYVEGIKSARDLVVA